MAIQPKKNQPIKAVPKKPIESLSLFARWEKKLASRQKTVLFISLGISVLFSILLFDVKVSEMNDDSMYIESGNSFAQNIRVFSSANAPLYPLILSIPIRFFGVNLILLKLFSVLFMQLALLFFFLAFKNRTPMLVLIPVIMILAVNSQIQYYASLTFTEALYMLLQGVFVYYFFKVMDKTKDNNSLKNTWFYWIILGIWIFLFSFCKNLAIVSTLIVVFTFLLQKRFWHALYATAGVLLIRFPTEAIKKWLWGVDQMASQSTILMRVDPYDASKGLETTSGYFNRLLGNTELYISGKLYQILGFTSLDNAATPKGLLILTMLLFLLALIFAIRNRNNYVLFSILYTTIMLGVTFIVLQLQWGQLRYILVFLPFILTIFFYGIYSLVIKRSSFTQLIYIIFAGIFFFSSFISSSVKAAKNFNVLKKNLTGDIYYGYTEDWVNYLKMSSYCADSLPKKSFVAARKAPMSFIYGHGKKFFGVYGRFSQDPDTILNTFRDAKVTHVILASLRTNPKKADGQIISTVHYLMQIVVNKYPEKLVLVKQIGETEPAYLYEIKY